MKYLRHDAVPFFRLNPAREKEIQECKAVYLKLTPDLSAEEISHLEFWVDELLRSYAMPRSEYMQMVEYAHDWAVYFIGSRAVCVSLDDNESETESNPANRLLDAIGEAVKITYLSELLERFAREDADIAADINCSRPKGIDEC